MTHAHTTHTHIMYSQCRGVCVCACVYAIDWTTSTYCVCLSVSLCGASNIFAYKNVMQYSVWGCWMPMPTAKLKIHFISFQFPFLQFSLHFLIALLRCAHVTQVVCDTVTLCDVLCIFYLRMVFGSNAGMYLYTRNMDVFNQIFLYPIRKLCTTAVYSWKQGHINK